MRGCGDIMTISDEEHEELMSRPGAWSLEPRLNFSSGDKAVIT